jgi:hypothetical protein
MDAGCGNDTKLRRETTTLGMSYVAGIGSNTSAWPPGTGPVSAPSGKGIGRPRKLLRRDEQHQPTSVKALPPMIKRKKQGNNPVGHLVVQCLQGRVAPCSLCQEAGRDEGIAAFDRTKGWEADAHAPAASRTS